MYSSYKLAFMNKKLLIYHLKGIENYYSIISICKLMNIELYEIEDHMIHLKIKDLLNKKVKKRKNKSLAMPLIVFSGFTPENIDNLLNALKNGNVPFIPLKASVTATNLNWSFEQLYEHILKEYQQVVQKQFKL